MSGGLTITLRKDEITADLRRKAARVSNPAPVLFAMGTELVSITKRAFRDEALRVSAWKPSKKAGGSTLINKGMLLSSIRIVAVTAATVTVGSDRKYAAIHQFGGVIVPKNKKALKFQAGGKTIFTRKVTIPARPFFPFTKSGQMAPFAEKKVTAVAGRALDRLLAE